MDIKPKHKVGVRAKYVNIWIFGYSNDMNRDVNERDQKLAIFGENSQLRSHRTTHAISSVWIALR